MSADDVELRKLKAARISILSNRDYALWAPLLMVGTTELSDDIPTARTDGFNEVYGRGFVALLTDKMLRFVILHETLHKAFRHLTVWRSLHQKDPVLANQACDHVINITLSELDRYNKFIQLPQIDGQPFGCCDYRFQGMNSREIFDILLQEKQAGGGSSPEEGIDEHDWDGATTADAEQVSKQEKDIERALRQGLADHHKHAGKNSGGLERLVNEVLNPQLDWKYLMREFARSHCSRRDVSSWRRPNRRFLSDDIYMPSLVGETIGSVAFLVDTSGSIADADLAAALAELRELCEEIKPEKVDLIYWDTKVSGHEVYAGSDISNIIGSTKPAGGGGTDPQCVVDYMKNHKMEPEIIICVTDGYVSRWGDGWPAPILWVLSARRGKAAPVGKSVWINT